MVIEEPVLVDTSALLTLANHKLPDHDKCAAVFDALPVGKAFLCWPVITEAAYMLRRSAAALDRFFSEVDTGVLLLLGLSRIDIAAMQAIMRKYDDQEVDLADAAIVHLANREDIRTVFTLDRRHFRLFTRADGSPFRLLPDDWNRGS